MIQLWQLKMSSPPKEQTLSWELLGWIKHSWDDYKKHYLEYKIGKIRMSTQKKKSFGKWLHKSQTERQSQNPNLMKNTYPEERAKLKAVNGKGEVTTSCWDFRYWVVEKLEKYLVKKITQHY